MITTEMIRLLGHTFTPMSADDHRLFAGAPDGAYIWCGEGVTLIWVPAEGCLTEIQSDPAGFDHERNWGLL